MQIGYSFLSSEKFGSTGNPYILPIVDRENLLAVGLGHEIKIMKWDGVSTEAHEVRTIVEVEAQP